VRRGRSRSHAACRPLEPKLSSKQEAHLVELWRAGKHTTVELAELFNVARSTVYRSIQRAGEQTAPAKQSRTAGVTGRASVHGGEARSDADE
jgi:IS30 family transposase